MRVTNSMMVRSSLRNLNQSLGRLQDTQNRLTSGRQLAAASDDPSAAVRALGIRQELNRTSQQSRSLDDAARWLGAADTTLTAGLDLMESAKEITVRATNTGSIGDPAARQAMAAEIRSIRADLLAMANTRHGSRAIFAGTVPGPAYSPAGVFIGNAASVVRDVGPNTSVTVNVAATAAFGTAGGPVGDVFEVLDRLATAINNGDTTAIGSEHTNLDAAAQTMSAATVEIGTRAARLDQIKSRTDVQTAGLRVSLSDIEDVDVVEALVTAKAQENAYTAALQTTAKILPMSLLDFLR